jgi:hypothetical protein
LTLEDLGIETVLDVDDDDELAGPSSSEIASGVFGVMASPESETGKVIGEIDNFLGSGDLPSEDSTSAKIKAQLDLPENSDKTITEIVDSASPDSELGKLMESYN